MHVFGLWDEASGKKNRIEAQGAHANSTQSTVANVNDQSNQQSQPTSRYFTWSQIQISKFNIICVCDL